MDAKDLSPSNCVKLLAGKQNLTSFWIGQSFCMVKAVEKLTKDVLSLPARSRARLASRILDSLEGPKAASLRGAWASEAESRIDAYEAGLIPSIPGELVFKRLRLKRKK